ncbi:MAG: metal ABC transporter permease, partial [Actinomycetia bacterium]|nr:metal ABC transporter permease [Actinomycetes bacterium]
VGNLLVFAFLVAPPATATLLVRRVPMIMLTAIAIGTTSVMVGLLISYRTGSAPGATMALVAVGCYLAALLGQAVMRPSTISTG